MGHPLPTLNLTEAHPDHAFALAPHLRKADQLEIECNFPNQDHGKVLQYGIESSDEAFTICAGDTIHGLWGHGHWSCGGPHPGGLGYVWLLSDDALFKSKKHAVTRFARRVVFPALDQVYPVYGNWVHSKNLVHVRWLMASGFKATQHTLINGNPFTLYLRCAHQFKQQR